MFGKTEGKNFSHSDRRARATIFPNSFPLAPSNNPCYPRISLVCRSSVTLDNVPRFIPLIALPFPYSSIVRNSGNEYRGLASVYKAV